MEGRRAGWMAGWTEGWVCELEDGGRGGGGASPPL